MTEKNAAEIVVPFQAVQVDEQGKNFVYIAGTDKTAQKKQVQTGTLYSNGIAITSGLSGSEQLITSGFQKLTDKTPVAFDTQDR